MARSEIPVTDVVRDGIRGGPSVPSSTAGHYFVGNLGNTWLEIDSNEAGTVTVLVEASELLDVDGLHVDPFEIDVPPGTQTKAGPWKMRTFNQDREAGSVFVTPPVSDTLGIRAYKITPAN